MNEIVHRCVSEVDIDQAVAEANGRGWILTHVVPPVVVGIQVGLFHLFFQRVAS